MLRDQEAALDGAVDRVHATAIAIDGRAVLIRGASGSGKSDLALRCLAHPASPLSLTPARLVADDQVVLKREGMSLVASAPPALFGKIEVRGLGILDIGAVRDANVVLVAVLDSGETMERYPDPWPVTTLLGLAVPSLSISAYEASAALKLLAALTMTSLPALKPAP